MTERYESPEVKAVVTKEEIHKRYQDAALIIFKVIIYLRRTGLPIKNVIFKL